MSLTILLLSSFFGLGFTQSTQQPLSTQSQLPLSAGPNGSDICLSIVNSALQTLNSTFELQAAALNQPFDLTLLPDDCFFFKSPETTCQQFPNNLGDMISVMVWVTQLIQRCEIPGSWVGYPTILPNVNQGVRQFSTSLGASGSAGPAGTLGVSSSVGSNGANLGGSIGMAPNNFGGYGQGSAMVNTGASGTPIMMVPVQAQASVAATPPNPFSTMLGIIGSSVGPQGVTISPATIAGILSLINQVVGIAVQLAPIGGAIAGPLGAALG